MDDRQKELYKIVEKVRNKAHAEGVLDAYGVILEFCKDCPDMRMSNLGVIIQSSIDDMEQKKKKLI